MSIGLNQRESQSGQPLDVSVLDYGGTFVQHKNTYYLSIGAQIHNPNKFYTASRVFIKINVLDASGRVIDYKNVTLCHIAPDTVFNYGEEHYFFNGPPSDFQIFATAESFNSFEDGSKVYDGIDVDYKFAEESDLPGSIKGQVTSRYVKKLEYVTVYLMFLDSNNKIKGGYHFSFRYLFSNVTEAFSYNVIVIDLNSISYVRHSIDIYSS
jgi:hypothetical protein